MSSEIEVEAEDVTEETHAIAVREDPPHEQGALTLFGTNDPALAVRRAVDVANALADIIREKRLAVRIQGKEHVMVEGWTLLGSLVGVFPVLDYCEPIEVEGVSGFVAQVTAKTRAGEEVGRAKAYCMRSESKWRTADTYAVSSMAQTRATSKALRQPLDFIMKLAGYEATPEAEMPTAMGRTATSESEDPEQRKKALAHVREELARLDGSPGWSEDEVVAQANATWKKHYTSLDDMTVQNLRAIYSSARSATP